MKYFELAEKTMTAKAYKRNRVIELLKEVEEVAEKETTLRFSISLTMLMELKEQIEEGK